MPKHTIQRDRVFDIAESDPKGALILARSIKDPWFKCQALSCVACYIEDETERIEILNESFRAGVQTKIINRIVTVSSWPLSVLCEFGDDSRIRHHFDRLVSFAKKEESPVRRGHALNALSSALIKGPPDVINECVDELIMACTTKLRSGKKNKRGESILVQLAIELNPSYPERTAEIRSLITGPTNKFRLDEGLKRAKGSAKS